MTRSVFIIAAAVILPLAPAVAQVPVEGTTLAKFQERERSRIMALDTNGDGKVGEAEWAADTKRVAKNFKTMDTDGDGQLVAAEIDARQGKRFAKLDANGDGTVTRAEQQAANAAAAK